MDKKLLTLSAAGAIVLASASAATQAEVTMHSRDALASCIIESAVAIAAAINTRERACMPGEWTIDVLVDEWVNAKIPIQGQAIISNGLETFELNGKMSARKGLSTDVICQVETPDIANVFAGVEFVYAAGQGSFFDNALEDPLDPVLSFDTYLSEGNVRTVEAPRTLLLETDTLEFADSAEGVVAVGWLDISTRINGKVTVVSEWDVANWLLSDAVFDAKYVQNGTFLPALSGCSVEVVGDVEIDDFFVNIVGALKVQ